MKRIGFLVALLLCAIATHASAALTVSLTRPAKNAQFSFPAEISLGANASGNVDIDHIEYYANDELVATGQPGDSEIYWYPARQGRYTLQAKVLGVDGSNRLSAKVPVLVNNAPEVAIVSPESGASYNGLASVLIEASATDEGGAIARVDFLSNGAVIGSATQPPYRMSWTGVQPGKYNLVARAYDDVNAMKASTPVSVTVKNPITVAISSPANKSVFAYPAVAVLEAAAANPASTIASVSFYEGETLVATATVAPYSFVWKDVPLGVHTITAKATDAQGLTQVSPAVSFTLDAKPVIQLAEPVNNSVSNLPNAVQMRADASDADGTVAKVDFYANGKLVGTSKQAPYTFAWIPAIAGQFVLTAKVTDNLGQAATSDAIQVGVINTVSVEMAAPAASSRFSYPADIMLVAKASDSTGQIAKVDFYNGKQLLGSTSASPFMLRLTDLPTAKYAITAVATSVAGVSATSKSLAFSVNTPPGVALTAPVTGTAYTAPVDIALNVQTTDADGIISRVDYYSGSTLIASSVTPPFSASWTSTAAGTFVLSARATDNTGGVTKSGTVSVRVMTGTGLSVLSPKANQVLVKGATSTLAASLESALVPAKVDLLIDGVVVGARTAAPFSIDWVVSGSVGAHQAMSRMTDAGGTVTDSAPVRFVIAENTAPLVSMTASLDNATAPATLTLAASASDSDGKIVKVEFYRDNYLLGTLSAEPYTFAWKNVAAGTYTLTVLAIDNLGAASISLPVSVTVGGPIAGTYYIHADHLNTPRAITDQGGNTVWLWESDPFGAESPSELPGGDGKAFVFNPRFPGQYFDLETGLHYNYYRDYDPQTGRYIQSDPIGLAGGISTYGYGFGNPISYTDPFGLAPPGAPSNAPGVDFLKAIFPNSDVTAHAPDSPPTNDECVQKYLRDQYGKVGGALANAGNLQQLYPSNNPEAGKAIGETAHIAAEKIIITQTPGAVGARIVTAVPGSLAVGNRIGAGLIATTTGLSGAAELAGAVLTPFGTTAMAMAREACTCKK